MGIPILRHCMEVPLWWPRLLRFLIQLDHNLIDPLILQKKIGLSLSLLVPEILGLKDGLFFHQNVLFNRFQAFCMNFFLDFRSNWPPFSFILNLFNPSFLQNLRSGWTWLPKIRWSMVVVEDGPSECVNVISGIPQGSVLQLPFFVIFINNQAHVVTT